MRGMHVGIVVLAAFCGVWGFLLWVQEPSSAAPGGAGFTDVTAESGVADIVKKHYENVPKWWLSGMTLVDLDGDGDLDLHIAGHGFPAGAGMNDGKGHFTYVDPKLSIPRGVGQDQDIPYPGGEIRIVYDFNEDGKVDLMAAYGDGAAALYFNDCKPGDPPVWNFKRNRAFDFFSRAMAMADLNRDGQVDYLDDTGRDTRIRICLGKRDGTFERQQLIPGGLKESGAIPVDIDGDGDLDLLVTQRGYNTPMRKMLSNDGKMNFTDVTAQAGLDPNGGSIHGAGDLDQDGDLDLLCVEGNEIVIYLNDGKGHFTRKPDAISGLTARPAAATWGGAIVTDFDNDGIADFLVGGKHFRLLFRGVGGGRFVEANSLWSVPSASTIMEELCFGDIDNDGDLDLVSAGPPPAGRERGVMVLRNDLPKKHWVRVRPVGLKGNRSAGGSKIRIYEPGGMANPKKLIWFEQVAIWGRESFHSYYTAAQTERHFGLGDRTGVDVSVEFYPSGKKVEKKNVRADTVVEIREDGTGN